MGRELAARREAFFLQVVVLVLDVADLAAGQVELALVVGHAFDVVGRQGTGVVQDAPDQRRLPVVDTADGGQAQELAVAVVAAGRGGLDGGCGHQK